MIGRHLVVVVVAIVALLPAGALAHVEVLPARVVAGEPTTFTIRVPQEEGVVTRVRVNFPESVAVYGLRPPPGGFTVDVIERDGAIRGADYRGGRIGAHQYQDFQVIGTPQEVGPTIWRVEERLADGSVRLWTGTPEGIDAPRVEPTTGEAGPAALVEVVADGGPSAMSDSDDDAALWLALIAAALAVAALLAAGMLWSSRPIELPPDDQ